MRDSRDTGMASSIFLLLIKHKEIRSVVKLKQSHSVCKAIFQKEFQGTRPHSSTSVLGKLHGLCILLFLLYKIPFLLPPTCQSWLLVGDLVIFYLPGSNMGSIVKAFLTSLWKRKKTVIATLFNNVFSSISRHCNLFICMCMCMYLTPNKMSSTPKAFFHNLLNRKLGKEKSKIKVYLTRLPSSTT